MQGSAIDPPEVQDRLWEGFTRTRLGFDVGANVGQSIGRMLTVCEEVVAFEPASESFEVLHAEYGARDDVILMRAALSKDTGSVRLMAAPKKIATGQLVTGDAAPDWGGEGDWDLTGAVERSVLAYSLDDFASLVGQPPGFMKIDVEGHELLVLLGGQRVLDGGVEMLIEIHSQALGEAVCDLLGDRYRIEHVRHPHYLEGSELWRTHFWVKCWPSRVVTRST